MNADRIARSLSGSARNLLGITLAGTGHAKLSDRIVESTGPFASVGEICRIHDAQGRVLPGEIIGFLGSTVLSMPLDTPRGVRLGDRVVTWGEHAALRVGEEMLGRVVDGSGNAARLASAPTARATIARSMAQLLCRWSAFPFPNPSAAAFAPSTLSSPAAADSASAFLAEAAWARAR